MRSRAEQRLADEGWTNIEWLPMHLNNIAEHRARDVFSVVLDATLPTPRLVEEVLRTLDDGRATLSATPR